MAPRTSRVYRIAGGIFVSPVTSFVGSASMRRKKYTRPDPSPAIIVRPSGVTAQLKHATLSSGSGYLLSHSPSPRAAAFGHPTRDCVAAVGRHRHGPDPVRMAFEGADRLAGLRSQSRSVWSAEPERARRPSGVIATAMTAVRMAFERTDRLAGSKSQSRSVWSAEPETARRPSGVTATALTQPVWPSRVRIVWPLSRSHRRSVRRPKPRRHGDRRASPPRQ